MTQRITAQDLRNLDAESFLRDVIGAQNIRRDGDELRHSCPLPWGLHKNGDSNPSASLNAAKLVFYCHGCQGAGDVIWLAQEVLGEGSTEARRIISEALRPTTISPEKFLQELEELWRIQEVSWELPAYSTALLKAWNYYSDYLTNRGVSHEVQRLHSTGVDFHHRDKNETDGRWIEQPRVVIPHFFREKLRGWSKRKLADWQIGTKYTHSSSFPKSSTLFHYDHAYTQASVIVVESQLSVLYLESHDFPNAVATFGDWANEEQVNLLRDWRDVYLFPDGDDAGFTMLEGRKRKGKKKPGLIEALEPFTSVWVIDHGKDGKDAANFSTEELKELVDAAIPGSLWLAEREAYADSEKYEGAH